jgi:hypothetical protein
MHTEVYLFLSIRFGKKYLAGIANWIQIVRIKVDLSGSFI